MTQSLSPPKSNSPPTTRPPYSPENRRPTGKLHLWHKHFFDETNPITLLNPTESARLAGYSNPKSAGAANMNKYRTTVDHFSRSALDPDSLKEKVESLMEAKETKFYSHKGVVTDQREVDALGVQVKATEMGLKVAEIGGYGKPEMEVNVSLMAMVVEKLQPNTGRGDMTQNRDGVFSTPHTPLLDGGDGSGCRVENVIVGGGKEDTTNPNPNPEPKMTDMDIWDGKTFIL
jgi:hypothetical protein